MKNDSKNDIFFPFDSTIIESHHGKKMIPTLKAFAKLAIMDGAFGSNHDTSHVEIFAMSQNIEMAKMASLKAKVKKRRNEFFGSIPSRKKKMFVSRIRDRMRQKKEAEETGTDPQIWEITEKFIVYLCDVCQFDDQEKEKIVISFKEYHQLSELCEDCSPRLNHIGLIAWKLFEKKIQEIRRICVGKNSYIRIIRYFYMCPSDFVQMVEEFDSKLKKEEIAHLLKLPNRVKGSYISGKKTLRDIVNDFEEEKRAEKIQWEKYNREQAMKQKQAFEQIKFLMLAEEISGKME